MSLDWLNAEHLIHMGLTLVVRGVVRNLSTNRLVSAIAAWQVETGAALSSTNPWSRGLFGDSKACALCGVAYPCFLCPCTDATHMVSQPLLCSLHCE
jgi:hypothetical protein